MIKTFYSHLPFIDSYINEVFWWISITLSHLISPLELKPRANVEILSLLFVSKQVLLNQCATARFF